MPMRRIEDLDLKCVGLNGHISAGPPVNPLSNHDGMDNGNDPAAKDEKEADAFQSPVIVGRSADDLYQSINVRRAIDKHRQNLIDGIIKSLCEPVDDDQQTGGGQNNENGAGGDRSEYQLP